MNDITLPDLIGEPEDVEYANKLRYVTLHLSQDRYLEVFAAPDMAPFLATDLGIPVGEAHDWQEDMTAMLRKARHHAMTKTSAYWWHRESAEFPEMRLVWTMVKTWNALSERKKAEKNAIS